MVYTNCPDCGKLITSTSGHPPLVVDDCSKTQVIECGLTKREFFAAIILNGIFSDSHTYSCSFNALAEEAVDGADALIQALNKHKEIRNAS